MDPVVKISGMGEGNTPIVASVHAAGELGLEQVFFKLENLNPTGSYKDRFISVEIERMMAKGARACVATSSGNTGSSLAAYCARYHLPCFIVVNADAPKGKLEQMQAHGARVFQVQGFISSSEITSEVFSVLSRLSREQGIPLIVSAFRHCPEGMTGVERISAELKEQLGELDHVFVPVGGGGLVSAICKGFKKLGGRLPRVYAVQPSQCSTVAAAYERGDNEIRPVESHTRISGLAVPFDIDAALALSLVRELKGAAFGVADEEILDAQRTMLEKEGIYCEPAGAAALAGLRRAVSLGMIDKSDKTACLVTGHGFKDPEAIRAIASGSPAVAIPARDLERCILQAV